MLMPGKKVDPNSLIPERKRRQQVVQDIVVISGIERDFLSAAGFSQSAHDVDRLIPIEGSDLDCDHIVDLGELAPEFVR